MNRLRRLLPAAGLLLCQTAIAQVHVREPTLKITKGVVAVEARNTHAVVTPPPPPVTFTPFGGTMCPRFTGTIDSAYLNPPSSTSASINSDISSLDANDCVTFAIVVENTGGSAAYDVKLREIFPLGPTDIPDCFSPDFKTLCITDGTGAFMPFSPNPAVVGFGTTLITLQDPLPGLTSTTAPGKNIAVITFGACIVGNIKPHCCDNTARVEHYSSTQGGPNFVRPAGFGPTADTARVCVLPKATKSIKPPRKRTRPARLPAPRLTGEQLAG